ncbi:MAG: hypothetical protein R3F33_03930 [Planctomycetota bacterium]
MKNLLHRFLVGCGLIAPACVAPQQNSEKANTPSSGTDGQGALPDADLRADLRAVVWGEVRLNQLASDQIVEKAREIYLVDQCPPELEPGYVDYLQEQIQLATETLSQEQADWPAETDCDRLDAVEAELREKGILFWQVSPCCMSCSWGDVPLRIDFIESRFPGFRARIRGAAFFYDQSLAEELADNDEITLALAYGQYSQDEQPISEEAEERESVAIGHEVVSCLKRHRLKPEWTGNFDRKILVPVRWQRRTIVE